MPSILCITPNFTIDILLTVPPVELGKVYRSAETVEIPGGKGVNVARVLASLGVQAEIAGFLAGHNGRYAAEGYTRYGLPMHIVWYEGETRHSILMTEPGGRTTVINQPGFALQPENVSALISIVKEIAPRFDWVSVSGSVMPGVMPSAYLALLDAVRPAKLAVDSHGAALAAFARAGADLLRINNNEAAALLNTLVETPEHARAACETLREWGNARVAISLGGDGAVGADENGCWYTPAPPVEVISNVGAGDAHLAGMLAALASGGTFTDALRDGAAAGSACCTMQEVGVLPLDTYQALRDKVELLPLA